MTRVLVTRAAEDAPALAQALVVAGFQPVVVPLATRSWRVLETADVAAANPDADWVLLTSGAVVDVLVAAAPQAWRGARWAAVGAQTARRAVAAGIPVTVTTAGTGVDLAAALGPLDGHRVVLPRGDLADEALPNALRARGATVVSCEVYANALPVGAEERVLAALPVDATTLLSGSAAERLAAIVPRDRWEDLGALAVIGPSTDAAARRCGLPAALHAVSHDVAGVVAALERWRAAGRLAR
jgi:uroporphyrinogen-III synthase